MKLTSAQIQQIKDSRALGVKYRELASSFGVNISTIPYHLKHELFLAKSRMRWKNLPKEVRQSISKKNLVYLINYQRRKYQTDEVFRESEKARANKNHARKSINPLKTEN
jgi:hypothetical protein